MTDQSALFMATWRTSSFSNGGGNCVEVVASNDKVAARDSKAPGDGVLVLSRAGFASLIRNLASG
jgi:hypothetical protein